MLVLAVCLVYFCVNIAAVDAVIHYCRVNVMDRTYCDAVS